MEFVLCLTLLSGALAFLAMGTLAMVLVIRLIREK